LAGAYSLTHTTIITYDEALVWIRKKDWSEEKSVDLTRDETALTAHLFDQMVKVETSHGIKDRNIGELIRIACFYLSDVDVTETIANNRLMRLGFKVFRDENGKMFIIISNSLIV